MDVCVIALCYYTDVHDHTTPPSLRRSNMCRLKAILELLICYQSTCDHLRMAMMHLSAEFGGNIFIQSGHIDIFLEIQYARRRHLGFS